MTISLFDDDRYVGEVGTQRGWYLVCEWVRLNPRTDIAELRHLAEHGWVNDSILLQADLNTVLSSQGPRDAKVHRTMAELSKLLAAKKPRGVLVATDGVG